MAFKSFIRSLGTIPRAGVGFLPSRYRPTSTFTSTLDVGGALQINGVARVGLFSIGDLVNVGVAGDNVDTKVIDIVGDTILTSTPFASITTTTGDIRQRFYPPKKG